MILDKGAKTIQWKKDSLFDKRCWKNWTFTCKRMRLLDPYLTPYTKTNFKWITDLNIKPKTVKLLGKNTRGGKLHDIRFGNDFLDMTPKAKATTTKNRI